MLKSSERGHYLLWGLGQLGMGTGEVRWEWEASFDSDLCLEHKL